MTRICPPPDQDHPELLEACSTLRATAGRLGGIAALDPDEFTRWGQAMRNHRAAWRAWNQQAITDAQEAVDRARDANAGYEAQGRAAGWWVPEMIPPTPTIPILTAQESAEALLNELDPAEARQWAWNLTRAVRDRTRT
jgi:hypothetical protein